MPVAAPATVTQATLVERGLVPAFNPDERYTYWLAEDGSTNQLYDTWTAGGASVVCTVGSSPGLAQQVAKLMNAR